jgi:hypothetical protein
MRKKKKDKERTLFTHHRGRWRFVHFSECTVQGTKEVNMYVIAAYICLAVNILDVLLNAEYKVFFVCSRRAKRYVYVMFVLLSGWVYQCAFCHIRC